MSSPIDDLVEVARAVVNADSASDALNLTADLRDSLDAIGDWSEGKLIGQIATYVESLNFGSKSYPDACEVIERITRELRDGSWCK